MQAVAAVREAIDSDSDGTPCPGCGAVVENPVSSDYRGLGRIEHAWQCRRCGVRFQTTGRMGGCIQADAEPGPAAAA